MWIFAKPAEQLTESDLVALITNGVRESTTIEFKSQMYDRRDPNSRIEMLRDISAIANAEGGVLIIGMDEDGAGTAKALVPVPRAEAEAGRIMSACLASLVERVPGLTATRIPITGGDTIVVTIPRSYRRPHMVAADGLNELWVRHDRQKSRMAIAEIRAAITATEELVMKAERFIEQRRARVIQPPTLPQQPRLLLLGTPLLIEEGRVDIKDPRTAELLKKPPSYRGQGGMILSNVTAALQFTMNGLRAMLRDISRLEIFRNGHVEYELLRTDFVSDNSVAHRLAAWAIAEAIRNFIHFVIALRELSRITDPYLISASLLGLRGYELVSHTVDRFGTGMVGSFDEDRDLILEPVVLAIDSEPDAVVREVVDRVWNAFHQAECPFFTPEGKFFIPRG